MEGRFGRCTLRGQGGAPRVAVGIAESLHAAAPTTSWKVASKLGTSMSPVKRVSGRSGDRDQAHSIADFWTLPLPLLGNQ